MGIAERQDENLWQLWRHQRRHEAAAGPDLVWRAGIRDSAATPLVQMPAAGSATPISICMPTCTAALARMVPPTLGANFVSGATPQSLIDAATGVSLIENTNFRPWEPVAPGVKPYRQHEYVAGVDYQIAKDWAFEARYDRRRLDHVIEDASLADPFGFEIYTIVNPGQGVNKTIDGYANFLTSLGAAYGPGVPAFNGTSRLPVRHLSHVPRQPPGDPQLRWLGIPDDQEHEPGLGRNVQLHLEQPVGQLYRPDHHRPDRWRRLRDATRPTPPVRSTSRSTTSAPMASQTTGLLPTDRPNTFKGNVYYRLPWGKADHNLRSLPGCLPGQPGEFVR